MTLDPSAAPELGTVRVVGTGLLGASVGLGLSASGARVLLADASPTALALARDLGAGVPAGVGEQVDLVVVATPPDVTAVVVLEELKANPDAVVTDVASVKAGVVAALRAAGADLRNYVGGHPMAGRERSGAVAARGDLFIGRPWVLSPVAEGEPGALARVRRLALALGAVPVVMPATEHDEAVALVSHVPQVAASLVAARLRHAPDSAVALAGQGLRDVTRIAGSDPALWAQILAANAGPVAAVLTQLRDDLDRVLQALAALSGESAEPGPGAAGGAVGARGTVARVVADGNLGRERIPGKHGGVPARYAIVTVVIPDEPGALGRVFADIAAAGTNVEEVALEHAPGRAVGLLEISVLPAVHEHLQEALSASGWHVVA
jgi:prephenate dehydrogenase